MEPLSTRVEPGAPRDEPMPLQAVAHPIFLPSPNKEKKSRNGKAFLLLLLFLFLEAFLIQYKSGKPGLLVEVSPVDWSWSTRLTDAVSRADRKRGRVVPPLPGSFPIQNAFHGVDSFFTALLKTMHPLVLVCPWPGLPGLDRHPVSGSFWKATSDKHKKIAQAALQALGGFQELPGGSGQAGDQRPAL